MSDALSSVGSGANKIGRYFTVVSALPSTVFVAYVWLLVRSGALTGPPSWSRIGDMGAGELVVLGLASFVVALTSHPLQFGLVQFFEGYWGPSATARWLAAMRLTHHRRRFVQLHSRLARHVDAVQTADPASTSARASARTIRSLIAADEFGRATESYPEDLRWILPTRLGNVLRRYEKAVGRTYGIDVLRAAPRLAMVSHSREVAYVENQRVQLDLAVRTAFLAALATLVTVFFMWRHGPWLLLAAVPYAIAYLAYRGSIVIAHEYGTSLAVLVELGRFTLYDRLRIEQPDDSDQERAANIGLMEAFEFRPAVQLQYGRRADAPADEPPQDPEESGGNE